MFLWYFFNSNFGRNSLDGAGTTIISTVHYGVADPLPEGAAWNGTEVYYSEALGYVNARDIAAHELTHGVIQYTANLFNYYQSGSVANSAVGINSCALPAASAATSVPESARR